MKKETIYALLAGCALFFAIFFASFWYFSRPVRPASQAASPAPVVVPEKSAAPVSAPPAVAEPRLPTPAAYGESFGTGIPRGSSPSIAPQRPPVGSSVEEDDERTRRSRGGQVRERRPMTEAEAMEMRARRERIRIERERELSD